MDTHRDVQTYFEVNAQSFDSLYGERGAFDRWFNRTFRKAMYRRFELALRECAQISQCTVLDVGCGSGRIAVELLSHGAARVVGIDFSEPMLELARSMARQRGVQERSEFIAGDFATHEFDEKFDCAIALGVLDYIREPLAFLAKMRSLSRKKVVVSFPTPSFPRAPLRKWRYAIKGCPVFFYRKNEIVKLMDEAGFRNTRLEPLGAGFLAIAETA